MQLAFDNKFELLQLEDKSSQQASLSRTDLTSIFCFILGGDVDLPIIAGLVSKASYDKVNMIPCSSSVDLF